MNRQSLVLFLFLFIGLTPKSFASLGLSALPVDGTNKLQFERIPSAGLENKKEIHIRVTSSNGNRYQVFERVLDPIVNERGESFNLQAIEAQTLSGSNSAGTLYLQNTDHVNMGDQLLYSSSQNGDSDGFIIGYSLNQSLVNASGSFRGRIIFSVRGVGNNSFTDQVILDVVLQTSASLNIKIKGAQDPTRLQIQGTDPAANKFNYVNVSFSGNIGQEIRIYQEMDSLPANGADQTLAPSLLQISGQATQGLRIQGLIPVRPGGRTLVYDSSQDEDNFSIYFSLDPNLIGGQEAGTYTSTIKYIVQTDQGSQEFPITIQCSIKPIFTMTVTTPPGGVSFSHVIANTPAQEKEVFVTVLSNIHRPYQVIQDLQAGMTNEKGKEFDSQYFNLQVEIPSGQTGQTDFVEFSPVKTGEYPVFSSDARGSGATFKLVYRLQGYPQMNQGNFLAPIRLSLNQK